MHFNAFLCNVERKYSSFCNGVRFSLVLIVDVNVSKYDTQSSMFLSNDGNRISGNLIAIGAVTVVATDSTVARRWGEVGCAFSINLLALATIA